MGVFDLRPRLIGFPSLLTFEDTPMQHTNAFHSDMPDSPHRTQKARSTLVSRNVTVSGRRTSVRLEPEMWNGLQEVCRRERANLHQICTSVSLQKSEETSLTAAIRVFVMRYYRNAATEDGHNKAGHGYGLTLAVNGSAVNGSHAPVYPRAALTQFSKTSFS